MAERLEDWNCCFDRVVGDEGVWGPACVVCVCVVGGGREIKINKTATPFYQRP